jgi:nitrite reductase/ring-hydroxylating ferredoxin subunit
VPLERAAEDQFPSLLAVVFGYAAAMANWYRATIVSEVPPGSGGEFVVAGRIIALFNVGGTFHALDGICPHQGGPLGKGALAGCIVTCPWHGFQFDVTSGQHQASRSLVHPTYPVKVEAGEVWIDLNPDS